MQSFRGRFEARLQNVHALDRPGKTSLAKIIKMRHEDEEFEVGGRHCRCIDRSNYVFKHFVTTLMPNRFSL